MGSPIGAWSPLSGTSSVPQSIGCLQQLWREEGTEMDVVEETGKGEYY